jgi:uncharacterized protein YidB (DUF937 family)
MGLLDGLLDHFLRGASGSSVPRARNPLLHLALLVLQQNGGIQGLLARLQQAGLGAQGRSWVSSGPNQPIDADALTRLFGHGQLGALAQSVGLVPDEAAAGLSKVLPDVVDRMTPDGQVTQDTEDLIEQALERLRHTGSGRPPTSPQ